MKRYVIHDIAVQGIAEPLLISNRGYRPADGPNAGKCYRAAWERDNYRSWKLTKSGLKATGNLTTTTGMAAYQPGTLELLNARPTAGAPREFDALFGTGAEFSAAYVSRIASAKPDGSAPTWADFSPCGAGIIRRKPRRLDGGRRIALDLEPTQALLEEPLLSRRFTGYGSYFRTDVPVQSTTAPSIMGGDFTVQVYGQVVWDEIAPVDPTVYFFRLRNAANGTLLSIGVEAPGGGGDFDLFAEVLTAGGLVTYQLGSVPPVTKSGNAPRFDEIIFSWDEGALQVRAWVNGDQVLGVAMASLSAGAGTEDHFRVFDTRPFNVFFISAVRVFGSAIAESSEPLRLDDIRGPLAYPEDDLVIGYEFGRGTGFDIIDSGSAGIDLVASAGGWGAINANIDGHRELAGNVIPAAFGQAFNVPETLFDRRFDHDVVSAAAYEIVRTYVNGVALTPTVSYNGHATLDGATGVLRLTGSPPAPVDFGMRTLPGQYVNLAMPGVLGDFQVVDVDPTPFSFTRPTTSAASPVILVLSGVPAGSYVGVATITSSAVTPPNWIASNTINPYSATGAIEMPIVSYYISQPPGVTTDMIGDPEIVASSPPAETFVDPGDFANVITQALSRYAVQWVPSRFTVPVYGSVPGSVGYFVNDTRSAADIVSELCTGHHCWLDEAPDGVSELRQLDLAAAPVVHVIPEGSIIDVSTPGRSSSEGAEGLPGLDVHYRRAWVKHEATSIPDAADDDLAAYITRGHQVVTIGTPEGAEPPVFETFENDRRQARRLGDVALALSQRDPVNIRFRKDPKAAIESYQLGDRVDTDAPAFDLPGFSGRIGGIDVTPAAGTVTLTLVEV